MRSNIHTSRHLSYLLTYGTLNRSDFVRGMNNKVQRCAKQPPHRNLFACVGSLPPHVFGQTCFRDNVEDEWLIVYILFKLSERFEDLVIRQVPFYGVCTVDAEYCSVSDSDGEFLLIEAANMLPKWVNPESAENRVFSIGIDGHASMVTAMQTCNCVVPYK